MAKGLKVKVRKFGELVPTFVEVTREKRVRGAPFYPPPPPHPDKVKGICNYLKKTEKNWKCSIGLFIKENHKLGEGGGICQQKISFLCCRK